MIQPKGLWLQGGPTRRLGQGPFSLVTTEVWVHFTPGHLLDQGLLFLQLQGVQKTDQAVDDPLPEPEYSPLGSVEQRSTPQKTFSDDKHWELLCPTLTGNQDVSYTSLWRGQGHL